jgi:plastocyanin
MKNSYQNGQALLIGILILAFVSLGVFFLYRNNPDFLPITKTIPDTNIKLPDTTSAVNEKKISLENPKKSAHYETNTPTHKTILTKIPINIVIDFNFDLAVPSSISITKDGQEYATGETQIDRNKLAMRRTMDPNASDGVYTVTYNACWPDKSCHNGNFQFVIDKDLASSFTNYTKEKEVTIHMKDVMFELTQIRIAKGTKVTWVNDDIVTHYVNTDSHPAHTYFPTQNSKALEKGDTYSVSFDTPGIYPYHCSAHEATMKGFILVE